MNNAMAETIKHIGDKAQYNACCKELLSYKPILSRILKETVTEYQNVPMEIIQECIEGSPEISTIPVNATISSLLNTLFSSKLDYESKITILKKEHNIILEDDKKEVLNEMCNLAEGLEEMITEEVTERVTKDVTASVTAFVTADSIRKTANIMKKSRIDDHKILNMICEEFNMTENEVRSILN